MTALKLPLIALAACTTLSSLRAESIGWHYDSPYGAGGALLPTDEAGAPGFQQVNWTTHVGSGQGPGPLPFALVDDSGEAVSTRVTAWSNSENHSNAHPGATMDANGVLMNSWGNKNPTITFSDIPEAYRESGYSIVVYYGVPAALSANITVSGNVNDSQTRLVKTGGAAEGLYAPVVFVEGTDDNPGTSTNYTVFRGLDDPNVTISIVDTANSHFGLSAVQIVKEEGAPGEPSNPVPENDEFGFFLLPVNTDFSWNAPKRATSYKVFLWKADDPEPETATDIVPTNSYDPPADLEVNTNYLWKIVAVNVDGETPSATWSFFTGDGGPPGEPMFPWPMDEDVNVPVDDLVLGWDPSTNATQYEVYLWSDAEVEPTEATWTGTDLYYVPSSRLDVSTLYHWRVVAVNSSDRTPGEVWSFTTSDFEISDRPSIGWHYDGPYSSDTLLATDGAGASGFGQRNWNNHVRTSQAPPTSNYPFALHDSEGEATTAQLTAWTQRTNDSNSHYSTSLNVQEKLTNSFANTDPRLTFANIPVDYQTSGYSVVVYYSNSGGPSTSTLSVTGTVNDHRARTVRTGNTTASFYRHVGFVEGTDANTTESTNYSVFTGLNDPSFEISLIRVDTSGNNNGISAIQIVKEEGAPSAPINPLPADAATEVATNASLMWEASLRPGTYNLYLWKDGDPQPETPTVSGLSSPLYDLPSNLDPSTSYLWQVIAVSEEGSAAGTTWSFTTGANVVPEQVSDPTPGDAATQVSLLPSFNWSPAARTATYDLYLWKTGEDPGSVISSSVLPGYTPSTPLEAATSYSWRVDTSNATGITPGIVWTFTTDFPPVAPDSPVPADGAEDLPRLVEQLDWSDSPAALTYNVYFWPSEDPEPPTTPTWTTTASKLSLPSLLAADTSYSWRVDAVNNFGVTTGTTWGFSTSTVITDQESIGWNYDGPGSDTLDADNIAGVFPQAHWNNHAGTGQGPGTVPFALLDNFGNATTASVTAWSHVHGSDSNTHGYSSPLFPNDKLMNSYANRGFRLTFSGVPTEYVEGGYTVVVYYTSKSPVPNATPLSILDANDDTLASALTYTGANPGFTAGLSSYRDIGYVAGDGTATTVSNYTVFSGLDASTFTVFLDSPNHNGVSAIQIIKGLIEPPSGSPYEDWALGGGLTGESAAFDADPDHDGITNGIEFVIGGQPNPALPGSNSQGLLNPIDASDEFLVFTFNRTHASSSVEAVVEFSPTLDGDWTEATSSNATINVVPGEDADTVTVSIPKNGETKLFVRLRVIDPTVAQ